MRFMQTGIVLTLTVLLLSVGFADEGMWLPHQMKSLNLKAQGLEMDPGDLYKTDGSGLMSAIVWFGGGTGEFVSRDGLILTNHHVAFGALQRSATKEHNYIEDGFTAWSKEEEIPAPGYYADILLEYHEVTSRFEKELKDNMSPEERHEATEKVRKQLIAEAEKESPDARAVVRSMYSGNRYYLFRFKRLKDIRIVYAPPRDLGNFGGDIDNWMWPRHTADFTFFRAYVSPDNIGASYSEENVPYHPTSHLRISLKGISEGDFSFVMGFPGRTYRNYTLAEIHNSIDYMRERISLYKDIIQFYEDAGKADKSIEIKYARITKGLHNALKNYTGKLEGLEKTPVLKEKEEFEKSYIDYYKNEPKFRQAPARIEKFLQRMVEHDRRQQTYSRLVSSYFGPALLSQAHIIVRAAKERQKPDVERDEQYQDRNFERLKQRIKLAERGYDFETDRAYFKYILHRLKGDPEYQLPPEFRELLLKDGESGIDSYVDDMYDHTTVANPENRLKYVDMTPDELIELHDPLINLAFRLEEDLGGLRKTDDILRQERADLKKVYLAGLLKMKNNLLAPDANSTLRFTYGHIAGYSPRDAVLYLPQTTLSGVLEKDTGEFPFHVPTQLKELAAAKDFGEYADARLGDIPTCFLNTTNVTGGNSGSPTLNARGEQIGIVFDMTYESVIGDYYVIPELQRTISVDIRYVLFVTEKFGGVKHIIQELDLVR